VAAMASMLSGASADKAVAIACELDLNSAPPIYTEYLGPPVKKVTKRKRKAK
jgi:hypothetical protein